MGRTVLSFAAMLLAVTGCVPTPESSSNTAHNTAAPAGKIGPLHFVQQSVKPEVSAAMISRDIGGHKIQVYELTGAGPATEWTFEADEFRQVNILEKHLTEKGLTLVIFMLTRNNPGPDEDAVQVAGKLRLHYEWRAGQWILTTIENVTFAYSLGLSA